jgi:hypothetical protein
VSYFVLRFRKLGEAVGALALDLTRPL